MKILISCWFIGIIGNVVKIEDGYLYFSVGIEDKNTIDSAVVEGRNKLMFNITNSVLSNDAIFVEDNIIYAPKKCNELYCCDTESFLKAKNVDLNLSILNINFIGSAFSSGNHAETSFINLEGINSCYVIGNTFRSIGSTVIKCISEKSSNVEYRIEGNKAFNLKNRFSYMNCNNIVFIKNTINNTGQIYLCGATKFAGNNYYIAYNKISNSPYHLISIGIERPIFSSGVVEYNECYNDDDYISLNKTLSDFGLISFFTSNNNTICRYNVVHGAYSSTGEARGIFGDDGCCGVSFIGNLIWGCTSYCIDSRVVNSQSKSNDGNEMFNNICIGPSRFEGRDSYGSGYVVPKLGHNYTTLDIASSNTNRLSDDIFIKAIIYKQFISTTAAITNIPSFVASFIKQ